MWIFFPTVSRIIRHYLWKLVILNLNKIKYKREYNLKLAFLVAVSNFDTSPNTNILGLKPSILDNTLIKL